jgi:hypothetical protein
MAECAVCGYEFTDTNFPTRFCDECGDEMCESCDAGCGTVCINCENNSELKQ